MTSQVMSTQEWAELQRYYDARAFEYDDWYRGEGTFAGEDRPGWDEELQKLLETLHDLPPARVLDVGCGTGFLTRALRGFVVGVDQSRDVLAVASRAMPCAVFMEGDAFGLPFVDRTLDRLVAGHFYGHLDPPKRERFLAEASRVADELVVVDAAWREGVPHECREERRLKDGSCWSIYKRYFSPDVLLAELGGGTVLHAGRWFVVVQVPRRGR